VRWKLLDRVTELERGKRASGIFGVSFEAATLDGPSCRAVLPRVLALEAIGELAAWLVIVSTDFARRPLLGSFERARFARDLEAGERVRVECELARLYEAAGLVSGRAFVGDALVAEVERASCALVPLGELEDPEEVRAEWGQLWKP
jgi:3-hydroxymyristoyl/3-hydroxydecanoyl-(acyl carrier protein) dehydratase